MIHKDFKHLKGNNMNIREIAKKLAIEYKLPRADKYDLFLREYDNMVEVIGLVQDPTQNMNDFRGREMLFPKRWVTIGVLPAGTKVNV
jgi:hypothetical protein